VARSADNRNDRRVWSVVKLVERFYRVKHQGIPVLARAGMTAARTAARIKGGIARRLAEAGSVKVAIFEDQDFDSRGAIVNFKNSIMSELVSGGARWCKRSRRKMRNKPCLSEKRRREV